MSGHEPEPERALLPHERALLAEAVARHQPALGPLLATLGRLPLTADQQTALRLAVTAELVDTGFTVEEMPTARGRQLEALIDRLGHL